MRPAPGQVRDDAGRNAVAAIADALRAIDGPVGVAVSGGGDSLALLIAALTTGGQVEAATVDHGLRPDSAAEAAAVARFCAGRGVRHETLAWRGWDGRGNLQAAAREARFALLADWVRRRGLAAVLLGHTLDDQAETVLMRLARGAGVDGLAAMAPVLHRGGILWLRPFLGQRRAALRAWLRAEGVEWIEDPSNEDARFDRVKARRALAALMPLGIDPEGLADTAARLGAQRRVLEAEMARHARDARHAAPFGAFRLDTHPIAAADPEIAMRLLADSLMRVAGRIHPPRRRGLERLLGEALAGRSAALHGCLIRSGAGAATILREPAAVAGPAPFASEGVVWDARFLISGPGEGEIGALGVDGLAALRDSDAWSPPPDWRAAPRAARLTVPALRAGGQLVAVPHAGFGPMLRVVALAHQELPEAAREAT